MSVRGLRSLAGFPGVGVGCAPVFCLLEEPCRVERAFWLGSFASVAE